MVELASHHGQGPLNMQEIADRQQVSRKYLDTLFNSLKVAGLVVSRRGLGGGWELTRPPAELHAGEVLDALEGSLSLVQCVEFPDTCVRVDSCVTRELYVEIDEAIRGVLMRHTLADLLQRRQVLDAFTGDDDSGDPCAPEAPRT